MDKQSLVKNFTLFFIMGMIYFTIEGFWRGWTNITMFFIGGICAFLIDQLNQYPKYQLKVWQQGLVGTFLVTGIEFISGMFFNVYLGLNLWNYSSWGNIYGQICPLYSFFWFILVIFGIWFGDTLRYKIYSEGNYYSLKDIFIRLIKLQ